MNQSLVAGHRIVPNRVPSATLALTFLLVGACSQPAEQAGNPLETIPGYDLRRPDATFVLPQALREVSGVVEIDSRTVACIQDENGMLFIYDLERQAVREQLAFNIEGDYEGIARVGKKIYVLRSDGTLFEIPDHADRQAAAVAHPTGIPSGNNEGLCYDEAGQRLLIACKGRLGRGAPYKDVRVIYAFDVRTKTLTSDPVYSFDLAKIRAFAIRKQIDFPQRERKAVVEPLVRFRTSAIGIHSTTKQLYVLSAADHALFVFARDGALEAIQSLDPALFNKAEGITFLSNGDMLITNEGQDADATLLRFNYKPAVKPP